MSAKAVLREFYEAANRGDTETVMDLIADDVVWTIEGTTQLSGVFRGKQAAIEGIFAQLRARLIDSPPKFTFERLIGDGDIAVLQASGKAVARSGIPYDNNYCIVARVADGKLVEMRDYVDTDLIRRALPA